MLEQLLNSLDLLPRLPMGKGVEKVIDWLLQLIGDATRAFSVGLRSALMDFTDFLIMVPPLVLIILITLLAWRLSTRPIAVFTALGLIFIHNIGLWTAAMQTLAIVLLAAAISVIIGIPIGIATARNKTVHDVVWPVLDFMQTMPAFVYLIPAVSFFYLGEVPAVMATVLFAMPPVIRLTGLGIEQVPRELIEACDAFGTTGWQKLFKVQLPLAMPTIMAGINQCIMLSLSMVVIAAMIGAPGLGSVVWRSIQRLDTGGGFESGTAVVILAIILDRITQSMRQKNSQGNS